MAMLDLEQFRSLGVGDSFEHGMPVPMVPLTLTWNVDTVSKNGEGHITEVEFKLYYSGVFFSRVRATEKDGALEYKEVQQ